MDNLDKEKLIDIVNKSGFPFQIALKNLLESTNYDHNWNVIEQEFPWRNEENGISGYIDLIIEKGTIKLVIECKRILNEPKWIFLCPSKKSDFQVAYCLRVSNDTRMIGHANWFKFFITPNSRKSEFCIIQGKDRPLIENNIGNMVNAIEALSIKDINRIKNNTEREEIWYIPMIVTTASLIASEFEPKDIDLNTGFIDKNEFEEVPLIRFEKSIKTVQCTKNNIYSDKGIITCFVVNVNHLLNTLKSWNMKVDDIWNI